MFWQKFGPEVLAYAKSEGKKEFFMLGEVSTSLGPSPRAHTRDKMQAVLTFPSRTRLVTSRQRARPPISWARSSETTTVHRRDSNVYSCRLSSVTMTWAGSATS